MAVAVAAFAAGTVMGARHEPAEAAVARQWANAWERGDYPAMHALLSEKAQKRASLKRFERTYREAAETATLAKVRAAKPRRGDDDTYDLPVRMQTKIFGRLAGNGASCR